MNYAMLELICDSFSLHFFSDIMAKIVSSVTIVLLVFTIVTSAAPQYFIFKDFNSVFSGNVNTGYGNSDDKDQPSSNAIGSVDDRGESQGIFPFWRPPTIDYEKIAEMIDEKVDEGMYQFAEPALRIILQSKKYFLFVYDMNGA